MWLKYNKDVFFNEHLRNACISVKIRKLFWHFPKFYNKQGNQNTSFKQLPIAPEKKQQKANW